MKYVRKSLALLLALILVLALGGTAFAEGETGSITINDAVVGQTYTIYQILDLESYSGVSETEKDALGNPTGGNYAYKANSAWETWLKTQTTYVTFDDQGYVTWVNGADAAAFAKAAQKYAKDNSIANQGSVTATTTTVSFTGLDLGYYLVDTTLGTLCSLDTTNPSVVMEEKNEVPTNEKFVEEDSKVGTDGAWGKTNDADIGQTVNFKSVITAQAGAENYVFHDKMSTGLTLDKTSIKVNGVAVTDADGNDLADDNYTVSYDGADGCTFEIAFAQAYLDTINQATEITVTYSATLNEKAVVGLPGNPNESKLSYGVADGTTGEPSGTTPPSETTTYTWDMGVLKYANNDESKVLKDAEFVLLNSTKDKVATVVNGKITGWVDVPAAAENGTITWPANTVLTTDTNGKIEIDGLDADTYYLREVKAPAGYNKQKDDTAVVITGATTVDGKLTYSTVTAKVNNQSGTELPSTGGMGTTIFYVLGSVLVIGAAVLLVTRKRMSNKG